MAATKSNSQAIAPSGPTVAHRQEELLFNDCAAMALAGREDEKLDPQERILINSCLQAPGFKF